jgi:DNA repair protein RadD
MGAEADRLCTELEEEFPNLQVEDGSDFEEPPHVDEARRRAGLEHLDRSKQRPAMFAYQRDLADRAVAGLLNGESSLLALPTGAGKTRTACVALLAALSTGRLLRAVWLAPSIELIDQAVSSMRDLWRDFGSAPNLTLARDQESFARVERGVLFATPQAINAWQRRRVGGLEAVDAVVFDEAHQLGAATFREAVELASGRGLAPVLGLSATPGRRNLSEMDDLVALFGGRLLTSDRLRPNPVEVLQRMGILSKLEFRSIDPGPAASEAQRISSSVKVLERLERVSSRSMVFASSVSAGAVLAAAARSRGISAEFVDGQTPANRRRRAVERFSSGDLAVLVNFRLFSTGYDCPAVSDVLIGARVGSPILFEQIVGRGARGPRTGGSRVARIWQFEDHLALHGLPQSYYRYREFDWGT